MEKPKGKSTGRPCSICSHKQVSQINTSIAEGVSFRHIASQKPFSYRSVARHADNCLSIDLAACVQIAKGEKAFDFATELHSLYERASKMVNALERWLTDPDSDAFDVGPRATELTLIFDDYNRMFMGKPTRSKGNLQELLETIYSDGNFKAVRIESRVTDHRKLYLDAFKTLNDRLEQIAKFYGLWTKEKTNPADANSTSDAIAAAWVEMGFYDEETAKVKAVEWLNNKPEMVSHANN